MGRCTWMIVDYPSSFSRFRCTVSEKLTSAIFSHFPIFSKSVHPLITNLLWEMHHDGRNMPTKFQLNPVCRLGEMEKRSSGPVKIQWQQFQDADLNVEMNACCMHLDRGNLHKKTSHESATKPSCNHKIKRMQQWQPTTAHGSHSTSRYVT